MEKKTTLTKKQRDNITSKHRPLAEKFYMVTDQCFWEQNPPQDYNPLDPKRSPHTITLVDVETGSVAALKSGSIISIIEARE